MPRSRRRSAATRTGATQATLRVSSPAGDAGGEHLAEAARLIAEGIRRRASSIPSAKIGPSVHVGQGSNRSAVVYATAPNAYPIETGARHPLFGNREHWYAMKRVLFLEEGAAMKLDDAAEEYGKTADDWLRAYGFE